MDKDSRGGAGAGPPPGPLRILRAVLALPGVVLGVVPGVIVALAPGPPLRPPPWPLVAALPAALGLSLMAWTIALFSRRGKGTLAPWDAPTRLVVDGPYRHVRNPMMVGVLLVLLGEATAFRAPLLWAWLGGALVLVPVFIRFVEERRLAARFGADYERYRRAVPAWIPRLAPWDGA
ncbi:MAG: isoprenylcysteine carboxylmethyltransferase family protein [Planctomycetes bacterium]|nr:isoprenylcysteine carboxylmethyltransferase family protein [Planctomycetota bacterium]